MDGRSPMQDMLDAVSNARNFHLPAWLKDKYGLSWQIVASGLPQMLGDPEREKSKRVMEAMLKMEKLDMPALEAAYRG